ncbi:MAG: N-acetylmuramoyl-L-alanine amidase family protein [Elusimicrobiota bacterium]
MRRHCFRFIAALATIWLFGAVVSARALSVAVGSRKLRRVHACQIGGEEYLSIRDIASIYGGRAYYFSVSGRIQLRLRRGGVTLLAGSSSARIGDRRVNLGKKVVWRGAKAYAPISLLFSSAFAKIAGSVARFDASRDLLVIGSGQGARLSARLLLAPAQSPILVVIDAGHGGKDSGAVGARGTYEKNIALRAAKELSRIFKRAGSGIFRVVLTRDTDVFLPLSQRSQIANQGAASIFISLHCNSAPDRRRFGFEIYSLSDQATDPEAERLAQEENSVVTLEGKPSQDVQAQLLLNEMGKTEFVNEGARLAALIEREASRRFPKLDGGVHQAGFYVLRGTHAPAVLVEMDYISNKHGEKRLRSKAFREKLMKEVYAGVLDYAGMRGWVRSAPFGDRS